MTKTLGIKRSNFRQLERLDFKDIIEEVRDIFGVEIPGYHAPNVSVQAKRIIFKLDLYLPSLKCIEFIHNDTNEIIEYFYDWEDAKGTLMKFHAHFHPPDTPDYIRKFDPFHLHLKKDQFDQQATMREPDREYKCLYNILLFIKKYAYVSKYATKELK